jgi:hypothetical protein
MRKIEREMLDALRNGRDWQSGNTRVTADGRVYLHENLIATWCNGALEVNRATLARWPTTTTISRLRALGADVCRRDFTPYLDGQPV